MSLRGDRKRGCRGTRSFSLDRRLDASPWDPATISPTRLWITGLTMTREDATEKARELSGSIAPSRFFSAAITAAAARGYRRRARRTSFVAAPAIARPSTSRRPGPPGAEHPQAEGG